MTKPSRMPSLLEDFFRPWNEWYDDSRLVGRVTNIPAVNIRENDHDYQISLAVPGMQKDDFHIDLDGNTLTVSSEKEEKKELYTRCEYSYSSFSRSFTLPGDVKPESIDARYQDGELRITIPRKENAKKATATRKIAVK
ncbi:Hsp20/alpha crystallin family protein [Flavisolibacter nicotianae]|uniref:Hsp20/alpha crystallin family protein n=1 Tax=Flavisolibacter nicotianae TaxID=2364882 RepID=UPI001F0931D1|nr:Hsp20/alpha crystallin family protein [Flavisolibacter nicotianae]